MILNNKKKLKFSYKELLYHLPDYIKGNIHDNKIISIIENELKTNRLFRQEFDKINSTINFLDTTLFDNPPDNYFSELIPEIRVKIADKNRAKSRKDISLTFPFWRYIVPALTVILIIILYHTVNQETNIINIPEVRYNSSNEIINTTKDTDNNPTVSIEASNVSTNNKEKKTIDETLSNKIQIIKNEIFTTTDTNEDRNQFFDIFDAEISQEEELSELEHEIDNLSITEQEDLLNKLENTIF